MPTSGESKALAVVHQQAFNDFFLTDLGPSFLKTYYKSVIQTKGSIAVCAVNEEDKIIGFATGCDYAKGYNKRLVINNLLRFSLQAVKLVFTRPKAIFRLLKNFEKKSNANDDGSYAELFSIGVLPEAKGLGIGRKLLEEFEKEAQVKGCKKITLTTDFYSNDQVVEFYKKNGYHIFYDFYTFPRRRMYKMIKDLV
jgi:ribosomal protein S18 acetylase RimI-like enzyme